MTDVGEFIDDILQHDYDPVKAREYYLRTRKLKGRATKKVKQLADKAWETDKEYNAKVNKAAGALVRDRAKARAAAKVARQERLVMQQRRLDQAKAKAKKIKDAKKRRSVEGKLNALQGKLKKALLPGGIKVRKAKARPASDFKPRLTTGPVTVSYNGPKLSRPKLKMPKAEIDLSGVPVIGAKKVPAPSRKQSRAAVNDNQSGRTAAARRRASNLDDNMSLRPRANRGTPPTPKQGNDNLSLRPRPKRRVPRGL